MKIKDIENIFNLKGKNAIVVGGAGYLGSNISETLLLMGANVVVASRSKKKFDELKKKPNLRKNDKFTYLKLDTTISSSINKFYANYNKKFNYKLDIFINCAWNGKKNTLDSISNKDWDHDINMSLSSIFKVTKKFIPLLKRSEGKIVNISSMYGHVAPDYKIYKSENLANPPSYGAAKAGIIQLTKYLASFLSLYKINVNCISPGAFPFKSTKRKHPDFIRKLKKKSVLGRLGIPRDLRGVVVLLTSNAGNYINGQNICVDGGWSVR